MQVQYALQYLLHNFCGVNYALQVFNGLYPNLFKITTNLLFLMDRKSYMKFHLAPMSLTWSHLERSNWGQTYFRGL